MKHRKLVPPYLVKFDTLVKKLKRLQVILHYNFGRINLRKSIYILRNYRSNLSTRDVFFTNSLNIKLVAILLSRVYTARTISPRRKHLIANTP